MITLSHLLSLPKTSNAFTALQSATALPSPLDDGLDTPRKVARLTTSSDSASASRSSGRALSARQRTEGPLKIQIIGEYKNASPAVDTQKNLLRRCIRVILTRNPNPATDSLPLSYEAIYNTCRSVVAVSNRGDELYDYLKVELEQAIGSTSKWLATGIEERDTEWLECFNKVMAWLEKQISLLESVFTYIDQVYVVHNSGVLTIRDLAYRLIAERIFDYSVMHEKLMSGVKTWLESERIFRKPHRDRAVIPALIQHLITHSQYSKFEEQYVTYTRDFYDAESTENAKELKDDPKGFFEHARTRVDEEAARCDAVLPVGSWKMVKYATEWSLWYGWTEWVANSTLPNYMDNKDFDRLGAMYQLFSRIETLPSLCSAFTIHIKNTVIAIVKDEPRDDEMVQRLLDFKDLAYETAHAAFLRETKVVESTTSANKASGAKSSAASTSKLPAMQVDTKFVYAISDAFSVGFKARRLKPTEMIAKYVDKAMRKGQGKASDAEFQTVLDKVLALYRFTDDKDVFRTFYHRSLAKRLLLEKSASDDFERNILKKLKEQYDPEFGMGEEMFKDLALSRESMREYHSKMDEDSPGQKLTAMVLKRSAWPFTAQEHNIDLPPSMQEELTKYSEHYKGRHSGHKLDWDHSLGTATLKARFSAGVKEISVSLFQTIVLLLFNDTEELPFADIKEHTNMDDAELRRTLQSLACGKKKVLKKVPIGKDVNDGDVFKFNNDFKDPHAKIHINSIQAKVSPEESKRTNAFIEDDRRFHLEAAIVRIMKARKEMTYEQLKAATIDAVKNHFAPTVEAIKRRIDSLVEQEYLERSAEDRNKYLYVA